MAETGDPNTVFLIAGEPSGDALGGPLIGRLREIDPSLKFAGVGGPNMAAHGLETLFPMEELSVMGLAEVLPRLPNLVRRIAETARAIEASRPAVVVTIDSPDFTLRVAKRVRHPGIPIVHYVAPSVWAWRPGRARKLSRLVDHVMTLLPFEPPYFEAVGLPATFVGHPVAEQRPAMDGAAFRRTLGIAENDTVLAVLPGSRGGEVDRLLPVFGRSVERLTAGLPDRTLRIVVPTLPHLAERVRAATAGWHGTVDIVADRERFFDALAASDAALCASGTVVLELARAGVPGVVAYRVNPITAWLARHLIKLKYVSLINIVAGRGIMPEHLQQDCEPERLARDLARLLSEPGAGDDQRAAFADVLRQLGEGGTPPSRRAADVVISMMRGD
ncbi:MAG: lipid-A-disaccharide synthase [Rhodospirillales bacterium]